MGDITHPTLRPVRNRPLHPSPQSCHILPASFARSKKPRIAEMRLTLALLSLLALTACGGVPLVPII